MIAGDRLGFRNLDVRILGEVAFYLQSGPMDFTTEACPIRFFVLCEECLWKVGRPPKSRDKIDRARRDFHVGNLYINRKCTAAMVGARPFGGFDMSGSDSKSGRPDYLYSFTQAKSVAEKLV
jgi:hypothetical protein